MKKFNKIILLPMFYSAFLCGSPAFAQDKTEKADAASTSSDSTAVSAQDSLANYSRPDYEYNTGGKRDPFESLTPQKIEVERTIKGLFNYEGSKILGTVSSGEDNYALVVDEVNASYVLHPGDRVIGGYVSQITDEGVFLHIVKYGRPMTIKIRLESSKLTVIEEDEDGSKVIRRPGINMSFDKEPLGRKEITIEDISVPSLNTKTVEELWFGRKRDATDIAEKNISIADSINGDFFLIEPPDNSLIVLPYEIQWTGVENKTVTYTITIDNDENFSSPLIERSGLSSSSFLIDKDMNLPVEKTLYWQVKAYDSFGDEINSVQNYMSFKISDY